MRPSNILSLASSLVPVVLSSNKHISAAAFLGPVVLSSNFHSTRSAETEGQGSSSSKQQQQDKRVPEVKGYPSMDTTCNASTSAGSSGADNAVTNFDPQYPGTAVTRLRAVHERVATLTEADLNGPWVEVRRKLLWAGGLRDLTSARPGEGYTGHSFNDWNHVDLTTMADAESDNQNDGRVSGIAVGNFLGEGIRKASLPELGPGGSWSTCALGCNKDPPQDVAHLQFRSRIAFKLVWVPNENFDTFVLVDDDGNLLAKGTPSDGPAGLPALRERVQNYRIMEGSKYSRAADAIASGAAS